MQPDRTRSRLTVRTLHSCWWDRADGGATAMAGRSGILQIELRNDGEGPMGWYQRIHVYHENGAHDVYPAHNVSGWRETDGD